MDSGPSTWTGRLAASAAANALRAEGVRFAPLRPERVVLLDTFDGLLHRSKCRLVWRSGAVDELIFSAVGSPDAHLAVDEPPRFAVDLPRGPLRARIEKLADVRALLPLVDLSSAVAVGSHIDGAGKTTATVVLRRRPKLDQPSRRLPTWTVEIHPLVGYPKPAHRLVEALDGLGLRHYDGDTLDLAIVAADIDPAGVVVSPTVPLDPTVPAIIGVRMVLENLLHAMEVNWQGTIDQIDPEFLHDLRVAVRRARSVLGQSKDVLPETDLEEAKAAFGRLGELTGPSRDLDVFVIEWAGYIDPLPVATQRRLDPVLQLIREHRATAHHELATALRSAADEALLETWRARFRLWDLLPERSDSDEPMPRLGPFVAERIRKAEKRLVRDGRAITPESPAEQLHDLRKDAKKLRYLIECFGGLLDSGRRKEYVGHLKALQDNLGEHQDTEVHVASLRDLGHELESRGASVDTLLALGQLTELLEQRRLAARAEFAERFAEYDTKPTKKALKALLVGLEDDDPEDETAARDQDDSADEPKAFE